MAEKEMTRKQAAAYNEAARPAWEKYKTVIEETATGYEAVRDAAWVAFEGMRLRAQTEYDAECKRLKTQIIRDPKYGKYR